MFNSRRRSHNFRGSILLKNMNVLDKFMSMDSPDDSDIENTIAGDKDVKNAIAEAMESLQEYDESIHDSCYFETPDNPPPPRKETPPPQQHTGDLESILFNDEKKSETEPTQAVPPPPPPPPDTPEQPSNNESDSKTRPSSPTSKNGSSRHSRTVHEDWMRSPGSPRKAGRKPPRCPRVDMYGASPGRFSRKTSVNSSNSDNSNPRPASPFSPNRPIDRRRSSVDSPISSPNVGRSRRRRRSRSSENNDRSRSMSPLTAISHQESLMAGTTGEVVSEEVATLNDKNTDTGAVDADTETSPPSPGDSKRRSQRTRSSNGDNGRRRNSRTSESPYRSRDRSKSVGSRDGKYRSSRRRRSPSKEDGEGSGHQRTHRGSRDSKASSRRRSRKSESPRRASGRDRSGSAGSRDIIIERQSAGENEENGSGGTNGSAVPSVDNASHRSERSHKSDASADIRSRERSADSRMSNAVDEGDEAGDHVRTEPSEVPSVHDASYRSERSHRSSYTTSSGSNVLTHSLTTDDDNGAGDSKAQRGPVGQASEKMSRHGERNHRGSRSPSSRSRRRTSGNRRRSSGSKRNGEKNHIDRTISNNRGNHRSPSSSSRQRRSRSLSVNAKRRGGRNRDRPSTNVTNDLNVHRSPTLRERRTKGRSGVVGYGGSGDLSQFIQHSIGIGPSSSKSVASGEDQQRLRRRSGLSVASAPDPNNTRTSSMELAEIHAAQIPKNVNHSPRKSRRGASPGEERPRERSNSRSRRRHLSASPRKTPRRVQGQLLASIFRETGSASMGVLDLKNLADDEEDTKTNVMMDTNTPPLQNQLGQSDGKILHLYDNQKSSPIPKQEKKRRPSGNVTFARMNKSDDFEGFLEDIKRDAINALLEIP